MLKKYYLDIMSVNQGALIKTFQSPYGSISTGENKAQDFEKASILVTILGFSYLFSYFALIQPVDYWRLLFPSFNAEFEISWIYNVASACTIFLLLWSQAKPVYERRVLGGFTTVLVVMILLPLSYFVLVGQTQNLIVVLGSTCIVSIAVSMLDSTVLSLASLFPSGALERTQLGMGYALIVSALYRVATKAFFEADAVVEAKMLYFGVTVVTVSSGLFAGFKLLQLPLTKQLVEKAHIQVIDLSIWRKIWLNECMVMLSFATTYVVYPGVVTNIPSYNFASLNYSGWWSLILMTLFAATEASGRFCVRWRIATHKTIWKCVVPRLILIPLLILASKGILLTHDSFSIMLVCALGFTNGYVGTHAVIVVNDCVEPHEQSATGMFASLCINLGILGGASLSLLGQALGI